MAFTQSDKDRIGLNPNLQSVAITGDDYFYHVFGNVRVYFGEGNPNGEITAPKGSIAVTPDDMYMCGGTNVWNSISDDAGILEMIDDIKGDGYVDETLAGLSAEIAGIAPSVIESDISRPLRGGVD